MSLQDQLLAMIAADGPMSLAEYMTQALLHPRHGYYTTRDPLGRGGDFTTAPEISQMFGELLGLCLLQCWQDQGAPARVTLAELGPGRGTLMRDALRAMRSVPAFTPDIVLLEASPVLRDLQRDTLAGQTLSWIGDLAELPEQPLLLIANEFLDALPIRQFQRDGPGWREIRVGAENGKLTPGLGQRQAQPVLAHRLEDTADGDIVELRPGVSPLVQTISQRLSQFGGAALFVDYGGWRSRGDTFQALQGHRPVNPFEAPGTADLTAHVDFEALAAATAEDVRATRPTPQGVFLERLGITARAQALARNLSGSALESHIAAHRRLTHPDEMGDLFQVMGLYPDSVPPPPGLDA